MAYDQQLADAEARIGALEAALRDALEAADLITGKHPPENTLAADKLEAARDVLEDC